MTPPTTDQLTDDDLSDVGMWGGCPSPRRKFCLTNTESIAVGSLKRTIQSGLTIPLVQSHPHHEHNVTRHLSAISPESLNVPGTDHTTHQHATKDTTRPLVSQILIASGSPTMYIGSRAQLCACSWSVSCCWAKSY